MAKLRWGLIGGGRGSQIGPAHRIAGLDGAFELCAGALTIALMKRAPLALNWG